MYVYIYIYIYSSRGPSPGIVAWVRTPSIDPYIRFFSLSHIIQLTPHERSAEQNGPSSYHTTHTTQAERRISYTPTCR